MIKSAARTIGICSGKGGVGKTYCAINLAKSISRKGKKVLLIDCDFNLGNCAFLLGQKNYKTLVNISDGEKIEDCIEQLKYFDFIGVESGGYEYPGWESKPYGGSLKSNNEVTEIL